jgi:putative FmdB family regulatory protein
MPIYNLKCIDCGHEFEDLLSSHNEVSATSCENCGRSELALMPSLFSSNMFGGSGYSSSSSCGTGGFT